MDKLSRLDTLRLDLIRAKKAECSSWLILMINREILKEQLQNKEGTK